MYSEQAIIVINEYSNRCEDPQLKEALGLAMKSLQQAGSSEFGSGLGMTPGQMEYEIRLMRRFDRFLRRNVDNYEWLTSQFAQEDARTLLSSHGLLSADRAGAAKSGPGAS